MPKVPPHYAELHKLLLSSGTAVDILLTFDLAFDNGRLDVARSLAEWIRACRQRGFSGLDQAGHRGHGITKDQIPTMRDHDLDTGVT
jgi:hypothetical protein